MDIILTAIVFLFLLCCVGIVSVFIGVMLARLFLWSFGGLDYRHIEYDRIEKASYHVNCE